MAKKKIEPEGQYKVVLSQRAEAVGRKLYDGRVYRMKGKVLEELVKKDVVKEWQKQ